MNEQPNPEKSREKATDAETAEFLIKHIDKPCETELPSGQIANIREFYLKEAERILPTFTDPEAKKLLEAKVRHYRDRQ